MKPTPYTSYLRVYEPLQSFDSSVQLIWSKLEISTPSTSEEQVRSLKRCIINEPPNLKPDGVHLLKHEGITYVAPWSTVARCWAALEDFRNSLPTSVVKYFINQDFEDSIGITFDTIEDKVPHILSSNWSIPPRWFALFTPNERLRGVNEDGHFTILRTSISIAKARCANAHQTILGAFGEGEVERELFGLLAWLEIFNEKSIVELDYGGLATYLYKNLIENGEVGLEADTSVEDVASSISGLASGNGVLAGSGYERLVSRWRGVTSLAFAN